MKRYFLSVAAASAVALAAAGGALAKGHPHPAKNHHAKSRPAKRPGQASGHSHVRSLVPNLAPHPRAWLMAFTEFPRNPKPRHSSKPQHRHTAKSHHRHAAKSHRRHAAKSHHRPAAKSHHRHAAKSHHRKPQHRSTKRHEAKRQPRPQHPVRATTLSIYEHTIHRWILSAQGCSAARRHESGVVVLDFGKPAFERGGYGTILFSGRFATNHHITSAMLGYARGYVRCLPQGSTAAIEIARGTSNYHPAVPSAYEAGVRWARETNRLERILSRKGLDVHVEAAAADDAEPAWDPRYRRTREFFHGFRVAVHGHTLFNYGSLDGGVGAIWSARQAWYISGGLRHTKALPEIYNSAMADEWAELARIARGKYHRGVNFAGVMTQGSPSCNCGLRPTAAHRVLADALEAQGVGHVSLPSGGTNIVG